MVLHYEITKYKMEEFYVTPSHLLPEMKKITKRAWESKIPIQTDNRSFYPEFYKFARLFKIFGFFPVHLTTYSSDLNFLWQRASTLFSILTLPVFQIFVVNMYPLEIVDQFFAQMSVLIPLCSNVLCIYKLPTFIKLIQLVDSIDTNRCLEPGDKKKTRKNNNFVLRLMLFSTILGIFPVQFIVYGLKSDIINSYVCRSYRIFVRIMEVCFIYVVCYQLIVLYDRYHASLTSLEECPCEQVTEQMVEDYRLTHAQLVHCVRLLDRSFGYWLMITYIISCTQLIKACHSAMHGDYPEISTLAVLNVAWILVFVFYPAVLTDRIYNKNKDTIHFTFRMALKPYSEDVLFQIYYFMRQVKIIVASVSAGGLADVNKEIITKCLSLFATFLIATIQLEPQMMLLRNSLREWLIQFSETPD